jgi:hypothetical protein
VLIDLATGFICWRASGGSDQTLLADLGQLIRAYAFESTRAQAERIGLLLVERKLEDGRVLITLAH